MFGIDSAELLIVALVALVVIGPKDLPNVMRTVGHWIGRARGMARHFRSGIDTMMRDAELEEMQKKWAADNERIMRAHPMTPAPEAPPREDTPPPAAPHTAAASGVEGPAASGRPAPPAPPRRPAPAAPVRAAAPPAPPRELP